MSELRFALTALSVILVLTIGLVLGINGLAHHYDEVNCTQFGASANRTVKFVDYSYWSWACLTPTRDGQWIDAHNLREI